MQGTLLLHARVECPASSLPVGWSVDSFDTNVLRIPKGCFTRCCGMPGSLPEDLLQPFRVSPAESLR
ncbi:MAG: hypothetical protein H7Y36_02230 [Armatimonadetes bacterium]|nr:hypothetical protein [Akkermansiaceae bacterium]